MDPFHLSNMFPFVPPEVLSAFHKTDFPWGLGRSGASPVTGEFSNNTGAQ
jgi:hypothetical protein